MKSKARDIYLDFYRGIATISVVFIHTVYWSGENYLTDNMGILYTLVLLVDVPLFVFLSGWSAFYTDNIKRTFDNLLKIWMQYIVFIIITDIVCHVILHPGTFSVQDLLYQMVFAGNTPYVPAVAGSLWFMPMWIPVTLVGSILTVLLRRSAEKSDQYIYIYIRIITFLLVGVAWFSVTNQSTYFGLSRNFCFYISFFLLGYLLADCRFKGRLWQYLALCAAIIILWFLVSRAFQIPAKGLQNAKFPPHLMYFVASLLSVVTAVYFRGKIDAIVQYCSAIRFVGKNALPFYFSQGIGSSIIYYVYPHFLPYGPSVTLAICFAVNLVITLVCGTGLILIYKGVFWVVDSTKRCMVKNRYSK